jgi:hypothetical protein
MALGTIQVIRIEPGGGGTVIRLCFQLFVIVLVEVGRDCDLLWDKRRSCDWLGPST